jgi:hypothetical protein
MKANLLLSYCAGALLLTLNLSTLCPAQSATDPMTRMTITHVKPEMLTEWRDIQKDMIAILKKGGTKSRTVYQTYIFGNNYEYVTITPFASYAEFDNPNPITKALEPAAAARLNEKLRKCIVSSTSFSSTRFTDLSNLVDNDAPPPITVSARYRIAPGKFQEFENLVKSDVLPVYKKAKVRFTVNRRGPGTNTSDVTMVTYYSKFADMDGGPFLQKQLGQEAANKLNAKFAGIRTMIEVVTRRRVDELSF